MTKITTRHPSFFLAKQKKHQGVSKITFYERKRMRRRKKHICYCHTDAGLSFAPLSLGILFSCHSRATPHGKLHSGIQEDRLPKATQNKKIASCIQEKVGLYSFSCENEL